MRISKAALMNRWAWSTGLGLIVFGILLAMDLRLKALAGVDTADIQSFSSAAQFRAAFWRPWSPEPYAARAGFNLGFDYLLMPLYALSFFYSGIIAAEAFAPRPGRLRRIILLAAMVPLAGAHCATAAGKLPSSCSCCWKWRRRYAGAAWPSPSPTPRPWRLARWARVLLAAALAARFAARRQGRGSPKSRFEEQAGNQSVIKARRFDRRDGLFPYIARLSESQRFPEKSFIFQELKPCMRSSAPAVNNTK